MLDHMTLRHLWHITLMHNHIVYYCEYGTVFLCNVQCTVWSVECSTYTTFHWPSTSLLQYKGPGRERWKWMWRGKLMWRWRGMVRGKGILTFVSLVNSYWKIRHKGETESCDVWKVAPVQKKKEKKCQLSGVTCHVLRFACHLSPVTYTNANSHSHSHGPFCLLTPPLCTTGCFAQTQKSTLLREAILDYF